MRCFIFMSFTTCVTSSESYTSVHVPFVSTWIQDHPWLIRTIVSFVCLSVSLHEGTLDPFPLKQILGDIPVGTATFF